MLWSVRVRLLRRAAQLTRAPVCPQSSSTLYTTTTVYCVASASLPPAAVPLLSSGAGTWLWTAAVGSGRVSFCGAAWPAAVGVTDPWLRAFGRLLNLRPTNAYRKSAAAFPPPHPAPSRPSPPRSRRIRVRAVGVVKYYGSHASVIVKGSAFASTLTSVVGLHPTGTLGGQFAAPPLVSQSSQLSALTPSRWPFPPGVAQCPVPHRLLQ